MRQKARMDSRITLLEICSFIDAAGRDRNEFRIHSIAMTKTPGSHGMQRFVFGVISFVIVLLGVGHLVRGQLGYQNWWGGYVFAPFAIIIGVGGLLIAAFSTKVFLRVKRKVHAFEVGPPGGPAIIVIVVRGVISKTMCERARRTTVAILEVPKGKNGLAD